MKLDCDPTTIYAALLDGRYRGTIYRSDLASPNAYNTYQHAGLPPGPIANPGLSSINAALATPATAYLYFRGKGRRLGRPQLFRFAAAARSERGGLPAESETRGQLKIKASRLSGARSRPDEASR